MSAKLQRWIDLLAALQRRRYPATFEELAKDVPGYQTRRGNAESLRRMFERDKDELLAFGIPITSPALGDGDGGYAISAPAFYLPYLSLIAAGRPAKPTRTDRWGYRSLAELAFEPDELRAIAAAATAAQRLGIPRLSADARSALRKLGHDLPPDALDAGAAATQLLRRSSREEAALFDTLSAALQARKEVRFTYHSIGRNAVSPRTVHPCGLFFLGHWYLAATTPDDATVKNYRLSRMTDVAVNGRRPGTPDYALPPSFVLADHARSRQSWELGGADAIEVTVRVVRESGAARAVTTLGAPAGSDPLLRRFTVRRPDAFCRWLLGFAGDVVPTGPPSFVEQYAEEVRKVAALYAGADTAGEPRPRRGGGAA
ncbi:MAG TPA: WYL domain-containing protein [Gemmatimonadales bacterium]|nr:WYL domain-containing protein [Gemmatimonadales bacterium]